MTISQIQSQVADALTAAYPGIAVLKDDGLQKQKLEDELAGVGRVIVVFPLSLASSARMLNGNALDALVSFSVSLQTNPAKVGATPLLSNPLDEIEKLTSTVMAVGRGPGGRAIAPSDKVFVQELKADGGEWSYLFTFQVRISMKLA